MAAGGHAEPQLCLWKPRGPLGRAASSTRHVRTRGTGFALGRWWRSRHGMSMADESFNSPLGEGTVHLCLDMQRIFSSEGPWTTPWMDRVLPVVSEIASRFAERTIFTRFITPPRPEDMPGMWRRYYEKWRETTLEHIDPRLLELVDPLSALVPPATVVEKSRYSAFAGSQLLSRLRERKADTLVRLQDPRPMSACWRRCWMPSILAIALFSCETPFAVPRTRGTTPCSRSITAAIPSRSKRRTPSRSCSRGDDCRRVD